MTREFSLERGTSSTEKAAHTCDALIGTLQRMSKPKTPKIPGVMRAVLAANVRALTDHVFVAYPDRIKALVSASGVSRAQLYRVLSQDSGATIDIIERLALALDVQVYQLLVPNLNADNPQVIQGASAAERQLYASFARGHHASK
jgi:hypothetical protein